MMPKRLMEETMLSVSPERAAPLLLTETTVPPGNTETVPVGLVDALPPLVMLKGKDNGADGPACVRFRL